MSEPTTERYCVLVNGHAVEPGCWVDGHWGQYGPDHLADRAEELGWTAKHVRDDPRRIRKVADWLSDRLPPEPFCKACRAHVIWLDTPSDDNPRLRTAVCESGIPDHRSEPTWPVGGLWEFHSESADDIERWLNENTAPNCPHCGDPMYATSDGFYRHLNYPSVASLDRKDWPCEYAAIDEPLTYSWGWHDGEFFLWPTETWEEEG